ncbi:cysteine surface protein [Entamoeba histolytica HM-3:IMSS]|nr:cysteine surface protein [Entamoeba histolytica HM-3:IMSS]
MKIQISSKEENEKYSIRTNPNVITIEGGYACEFELFIIIKCTTKINDKIIVIGEEITEERMYSNRVDRRKERATGVKRE